MLSVPPEVSAPGAVTQFRMGLDAVGPLEFELIADPSMTYTLYATDSIASMLAGDYTYRICDLENNVFGAWAVTGPTTVQWTPAIPTLIVEGYWVVVGERLGFEGPYGSSSAGTPRPHDLDLVGSVATLGCQ